MSRPEVGEQVQALTTGTKRKLEQAESLEVDLSAPEPPSKKELRKAKKSKTSSIAHPSQSTQQAGTVSETSSSGRSKYGIWIGNLLFSTAKKELQEFITGDQAHPISADKVTRIHLPPGKSKHGVFQSKGFAYIDLADAESLKAALQLSEKLLGGRRVLIKDAKNFEGRPEVSKKEQQSDQSGHTPNQRIFVGNLSFDVSSEDLKAHFERCGHVSNVHMATFEDSGKCKGYAWVEFEELSAAISAMRGWVEVSSNDDARTNPDRVTKNRFWVNKIEGRKLRMEYAEDKTTRYNKRFGKQKGEKEDGVSEKEALEGDNDDKTRGPKTRDQGEDTPKHEARSSRPPRRHIAKDTRPDRGQGGYSRGVVDKLQGNIVAAEGKKITFD